MRRQYHFRQSPDGLLAWDVHRLGRLAVDINPDLVSIASIAEVDEDYWFKGGQLPTCRAVVAHMRLVNECDLSYPILLSDDWRVMDGMHRVAKALLHGQTHVLAKRFPRTPVPDHVGLHPDALPYGDSEPQADSSA